jgi:uncharacterized protein YkwD
MDQHMHSRRATRRAPFGLALVMGVLVAVGVPSATLAWTNYTFSSSSENEMITLINQARASAGLPALVESQSLTDVARWRSKDMYDRDYFSHTIPNPPGGMVFDELHRQGICYTLAGENIGYNNYPDDVATQTMFNGWMNSPEHKKLILGGGFNRIGLGAFKGTDATYPRHYWTAVFTHTCKSSAPNPTPRPTKTAMPTQKAIQAPGDPTVPATSQPTPVLTAEPAALGDALYAIWREMAMTAPSDTGGIVTDSDGGSLQVVEPPPSTSLLDTIVGGVLASFLGT